MDTLSTIKTDLLRRRNLVDCPSCENRIAYRMNHIVHGVREVNELAESMLQNKPDYEVRPFKEESERRLSEAILCPCCDGYFQIEFDVTVLGVRKVDKGALLARHEREEARKRPPDGWTEAVERFGLDKLMDAFTSALNDREGQSPPNYPRRYLATFLKCATPSRLSDAQVRLLREWGEGFVEVYQFQGIGMVVIGGEIRGFIPNQYLLSKGPRALDTREPGGPPPPVRQREKLEVWVRTRNGYVVNRGLMFSELKGKRPGDFAKAAGNY